MLGSKNKREKRTKFPNAIKLTSKPRFVQWFVLRCHGSNSHVHSWFRLLILCPVWWLPVVVGEGKGIKAKEKHDS